MKLPPFLGIFGSADLISKAGFRGHAGSYIEFRTESKTGADAAHGMRIAQVGPDVPGGRWIEISPLNTDPVGSGALLLFGRGLASGNVSRIVLQAPGGMPLEVPVRNLTSSLASPISGAPAGSSVLESAKDLGPEKVKVPLGTFTAEHWVVGAKPKLEIWTTSDERVPFSGAVKMLTSDGVLVATQVGTDAKATVVVPAQAEAN